MAAVADALRALGIRDQAIVLVPAHNPDVSALRSPAGRAAFSRHHVATVPFERQVLVDGLHGVPRDHLQDVSAGGWRRVVRGRRKRAAAHPHFERRKYLASGPAGPRLLTFEGLGRYGRLARARADALAGAGFVAPPGRLDRGFLSTAWIEAAQSLPRTIDAAATRRIGSYLGWIARHQATGAAADPSGLATMLEANTREALGDAAAVAAARLAAGAARTAAPAARLDARLLAHEWIVAGGTILKTDALHHHDDHFYPGPCDPAWDVGAAIVELDLARAAVDALLAAYAETSRDTGVARRLPFHVAAYAAFRLGYATLATETLGQSDDARRFARAAGRYRRVLAGALARVPDQPYISPVSFTPSTSTPSSASRTRLTDAGRISMRWKRSSGTPRK
jgi:hypothetical protein